MPRIRVIIAATTLLCAAIAPSCNHNKPLETAPLIGAVSSRPVSFVEDEELRGLRMTLREVGAPSGESAALPVATGETLSGTRVAALLSRVPDLEEESADRQAFALRPGSQPRPRTGETVEVPFPPPAGPPPVSPEDAGPLTVRRIAPEGEVPMAPHLSVTFSQPMIAVSSQEEAARTVPVQMTPEPAGRWRWLGTRTLMFDPDPRFPMATEYTVVVPAGTASSTGGVLARERRVTFSTPPLGLVTRHPEYGPQDLTPVIVLGFDQAIDPQALLPFIELRDGEESVPLRLATADEIAADPEAARLLDAIEPDRRIALRPQAELSRATSFVVAVRQGAPSAEGPRTTPGEQAFGFSTFSPLEITEHRCSWYDVCPPGADWFIEFNNPLDLASIDPSAFTVSPPVPGLRVQGAGSTLTISGVKEGRTTYVVTVPATVGDTFGQALGEAREIRFKVGPAEQTLFGPGKDLVTLDPSARPVLSVFSTNHDKLKVRIHKVAPDLWDDWMRWQRTYHYDDRNPGPLPGQQVLKETIAVEGKADALVETGIDLTPYLDDGHGQFIVWVEPTKQPAERWYRQEVYAWVQVTDLGIAAFDDTEELLVWVTKLADGKAAPGAAVTILPEETLTGTADASGLVRLHLPESAKGPNVLVARAGTDVAILPQDTSFWSDYASWVRVAPPDQMRWFTFDDRGMYRPGEQVRVKGWIRRWEVGPGGDIGGIGGTTTLSWTLRGPRGNDLAQGVTTLSALGGFDVTLDLPRDVNLGTAWLAFTADDSLGLANASHDHPIQIQEFRRPEFEVSATAEEGPWVLGNEATVSVAAAYYAGGGLPGAEVSWSVHAAAGSYAPPNRSDYSFGVWTPWWCWSPYGGEGIDTWESLSGRTDAAGMHHLGIHFEALNPPRPMSVTAEATVMDVNRQAWSSSSTMLVHPADLYVGLRTDRWWVGKDDDIEIQVLVVDIEGNAVDDVEATVRMSRLEWVHGADGWSEQEGDPVDCTVTPSGGEPATCTFDPTGGGSYKILATIRDAEGRRNQTELQIWVAGGERPPAREVEQEQVTLIPERQEYQPGETATLLVQAPFYPAEGLLTLRRDGLVHAERFSMDGPTTSLQVAIAEEHIPEVTVQVDLVGSAPRTDDAGEARADLPRRVAFATGSLTYRVPPLTRTLTVTATPRERAIEPGGATTIDVTVVDHRGTPVRGAEVAVVVADESVLALTGYELPDPIAVFYASRGGGVRDRRQRHQVVLSNPEDLAAQMSANAMAGGARAQAASPAPYAPPAPATAERSLTMAGEMEMDEAPRLRRAEKRVMGKTAAPMEGEAGPTIALRADLDPLALFAAEVGTDRAGRATVEVEVPDNLTRYRVMAVAVAGDRQFGAGESTLTARLPLMVRPSPPRFLNFGDRFDLPVVLQNQTERPMTVEVAVRATNLDLDGTAEGGAAAGGAEVAGRLVTVPANDRVEVRFGAAAVMAGTARLQVVAAGPGTAADAAQLSLPVWTPATTEAFATYGELDGEVAVQPVRAPGDVWPQFGGLEVTTSSTQLQALTDAVLYLTSYPFDCNEQIASRILAVAALRDVLTAFESEQLPPPDELEASVDDDLARLARRQNANGGWSFWRKGDPDWPYLTIHVAHAMARARQKGYTPPGDAWTRAERYLSHIESHIPSWYGQESRWAIRAYAIYVLHQMGQDQTARARKLFRQAGVDGLSMEALGWLLPVLHAGGATAQVEEILRYCGNNVTETASGAHFVTGYGDGAYVLLHSDRRVDGVLLEALLEVDPDSDLVPKLVRGLLDHRTRGRWSNTQENAFILLALDRYFHVHEAVTPDFVARVWLGDGFAGEHAFRGRTTERARIDVPMGYLTEVEGDQPLTLQKDGEGRLYYRIGMRYAPRDLTLEAADYGFAVERSYEAVDDDGDVSRDEEGRWHVRAGARVRVRVTMVTPMRRTHVALVDPLPAGMEPVNPELAVSGSTPPDPSADPAARGAYWWWWGPWYEHENLRDERVEAFTSLLWEGVYEYTYVARATTPGTFVAPPPRAEEMYHPETFGRGATATVIVE